MAWARLPGLFAPGGELAVLHPEIDVVLHRVLVRHDVQARGGPLVGEDERAFPRLSEDHVVPAGLVGRLRDRRVAGSGPMWGANAFMLVSLGHLRGRGS